VNSSENMHLVYLDRDFNFVRVNEAYAKTCGYRPEEMIGKNHFALFPGEEVEAVFKRVRDTGVPTKFHDRPFVFPDQPERGVTYWDWTLKPVKNEVGEVEGLVFSLVETTKRKKAEEAIQDLAKFPSENPNPVMRINKDCFFLYGNGAAKQILKDLKCRKGEAIPERWRTFVDESFEAGERQEFEEQIGGRTFVFVMSPAADYVNVYGHDITERNKAEENLRKSEQRYRSYIEVTGELGWTTNAEGEVVEDLPSWRNFTGQTFDEIKGSGWSKALHPDDLENTLKVWKQATQDKSKYEVEYRIRRHDGVYRYFMARGVPVFNEDGSLREWVGTCIDMTERKKAEDMLKEQGVAINSAPDAIFSTNNSFVIKSWNKAAISMFGWRAKEVIGKVTTEIFKPDFPASRRTNRGEAIEQLMKNGSWKGELIYHKKDGSPIPVAVSASLVKDGKGEVAGMVAVVHDISKRIRRVETLRGVQRDLNRAQAVAKTGSWRLDTQRNVLLWSDENHRIFGIPKGTAMTYESFLEKVHTDDKKYVDESWKAALKGEPYDIEHRIIVNGKVKWVRERAELEFDNNGTLQGGFGTTQEITDLIEMRQKLEDALVKVEVFANQMEDLAVERAVKLKDAERLATIGTTAGMVGHDIRNPLQAIVGDLYLLECDLASMPEGGAKEGMKESLAAIKKSVDYINKIVLDLQDYARPIKPVRQETDFEKLCSDVLFTNDFPKNIDATYCVDEEAKKFFADPELVKRILTNLVNNAIQAMPKGGKLEIQAQKEDGEVVLTVQDYGAGVPPEHKDKLFTPLFTTKSKGQGFGLAVVKRMTEALSGTVTFESEEGKGTKFIVRLPATKK
jgi:PAS domain S-box-containing protein